MCSLTFPVLSFGLVKVVWQFCKSLISGTKIQHQHIYDQTHRPVPTALLGVTPWQVQGGSGNSTVRPAGVACLVRRQRRTSPGGGGTPSPTGLQQPDGTPHQVAEGRLARRRITNGVLAAESPASASPVGAARLRPWLFIWGKLLKRRPGAAVGGVREGEREGWREREGGGGER